MKGIFQQVPELISWLSPSDSVALLTVCKEWNEGLMSQMTNRKLLEGNWPILGLILPRASDDLISDVVEDIRSGILGLRLDYDRSIGGYVYTPECNISKFHCNMTIPYDLTHARGYCRPWRAMNMEARGWKDVNDGTIEPHRLDPEKFLFHLIMTSMGQDGLYEAFLNPSDDRPYQIYNRKEMELITAYGDCDGFCFSCDGPPPLTEVTSVLQTSGYNKTAENAEYVLFERRGVKRARGHDSDSYFDERVGTDRAWWHDSDLFLPMAKKMKKKISL